MKTNFDKYRKCYYVAWAVAAVGVAFLVGWRVFLERNPELAFERWHMRISFWAVMLINGTIGVLVLLMWRYSKCPHCGKSVFPLWGSFKTGSRIFKRKPVICAHCGEEVETN